MMKYDTTVVSEILKLQLYRKVCIMTLNNMVLILNFTPLTLMVDGVQSVQHIRHGQSRGVWKPKP